MDSVLISGSQSLRPLNLWQGLTSPLTAGTAQTDLAWPNSSLSCYSGAWPEGKDGENAVLASEDSFHWKIS